MNEQLQALRERWDSWTARERRMVAATGVALALALVYLLLVDPALADRARLQRDLPELRANAAEMAGIAANAARLPRPPATGDLRQALETSLPAAGLKGTASGAANGGVTVKFEKAGYNAVAAWAFRATRDFGARIESANVSSLGDGGRVNAEFTFVR